MSIGIAIFASVVLLLVVYHKTFRKVAFWTAGITVALMGVSYGGYYLYNSYEAHAEEKRQHAEHDVAVKACQGRFPHVSSSDDEISARICGTDSNAQPADYTLPVSAIPPPPP